MEEIVLLFKYLPFLFVLFLTTILYYIYLAFHLLPLLQFGISSQFKIQEKFDEGIRDFVIIHCLVLLYGASLIKSFITDPGKVPVTEEWRNSPDPNQLYERKDDGRLRFCKYELVYKPDRSHYCKQLQRNVLRMDHYCPWFGNCIGFYNYKYFFLALLYGCITLLYMLFGQINTFINVWNDPNVTFGRLYLISLGSCFCIVLLIIMIPFLLFHAIITSKNQTTIEFCEKRGKEKLQNFTYDRGCFKNYQSIFGTNPLLWFFPVGLPQGDGLFFPTTPKK
ncbi:DHHC zinc finger domain-containing protein [Cryptosporidium serpentis]